MSQHRMTFVGLEKIWTSTLCSLRRTWPRSGTTLSTSSACPSHHISFFSALTLADSDDMGHTAHQDGCNSLYHQPPPSLNNDEVRLQSSHFVRNLTRPPHLAGWSFVRRCSPRLTDSLGVWLHRLLGESSRSGECTIMHLQVSFAHNNLLIQFLNAVSFVFLGHAYIVLHGLPCGS